MSDPTRLAAGALVRRALRGEPVRALPHLVIRSPGAAERAVALPAELTVGRGPEAGLVLADGGASRLHARIRLAEDGAAAVEDLGSKNGLTLNGRALPAGPAALRAGDELRVGATLLRFEDPLSTPADPEAPATAPGAGPGPDGPAAAEVGSGAAASGRWPAPPRSAGLLVAAAALLGLAALLLALG
jgi:hypothetical protein